MYVSDNDERIIENCYPYDNHFRNFGRSLKKSPCSLNYPGEKERIQFKKILVIERIFEYIYCESNRFKLKSSTAIF